MCVFRVCIFPGFFLFVLATGDPLMHKLAAVVAPMKSSFIVAHLRPREFVTQMQASGVENAGFFYWSVR